MNRASPKGGPTAPVRYRLGDLAGRVGGQVRGDADRWIEGIQTLDRAGPTELSFVTNPRYRRRALTTAAGALLVGPGHEPVDRDLLTVTEPQSALAELLELFHPVAPVHSGISEDARLGHGVRVGKDVAVGAFAIVGDRVILGDRVQIGSGSVIGDDCRVGDDTQVRPRVVLYPETVVGARCLLHSGVVIGADGFGFATQSAGGHRKIPQVGKVVIEDDVEIGANSAVDRAAIGETRIGKGTKIDDLVMVAHGVTIGPESLLAAQVGIAGSTRLGTRVTFAGQSGAAGHLEIGDGAVVAAKTAVFKDLPARAFVAGVPAVDHRSWKRGQAALAKLPELRSRLRDLERRLAEIERRIGEQEARG